MHGRTMVKINRTENCLFFQTINRKRKGNDFAALREQFSRLEHETEITMHDIYSFAKFRLDRQTGMLHITFFWLNSYSDDRVTGWKQDVRLPYAKLALFNAQEYDKAADNTLNLLSDEDKLRPRLIFHDVERLKAVVANPMLRHKLASFLKSHFQWPASKEIHFYHDPEPYSFFFEEKLRSGFSGGMCGAVVLHGLRNGYANAYYSIHT